MLKRHFLLLLAAVVICSGTLCTAQPSSSETLIPIVVESGTNLIKLVEKFCTSRFHWKEIASINHLEDPYLLHPGDKIVVPLELLKADSVYAQLASVSGEVLLIRHDKILKRLQKGDLVYPGQSVVTGEGSYAHLVFPDHRYTRIAEDSKFTVNYFVKVEDQGIKAEFFLEKGRITHNIKQRLQKNEAFTTRTPVSVTGVRGTEYRLKIENDSANIVETLKGNVAVASGGGELIVARNQGSRVEKNKAPSLPRELPHTPDITTVDNTYKVLPLSMPVPPNGEPDVVSYRMRLTEDRDGSKTVLEKMAPKNGAFTIAQLRDGIYYAFFTAIDNESFESIPTEPVQFLLRTVPSAPVLSQAYEGQTLFADEIVLQWLQGLQTEKYLVELATDPEFNSVIEATKVTGCSYNFKNLAAGTYFARISAIATDGFQSLYSRVDSWTIAKSPAIGELQSSGDGGLQIQWAASSEDMKYDLQVSRNESFTDIFIEEADLKEPKYNFAKELEPNTYYIRIRGVLPDGDRGPWSPAQQLHIPSGPFTWLNGVFLTAMAALLFIL